MIGSDTEIYDFISVRLKEWVHHTELLSNIAINQPQAAYVAMIKSMQHEWPFLQWVSPHCCSYFEAIQKQIVSSFVPSPFGCDSSTKDRLLHSLPARMGGLAITNPLLISYITPLGMLPNISLMLSKVTLLSLSLRILIWSQSHTRFIKDQQELHEDTYTLILN